MAGAPSKINPQNSHPSNPVHNAAQKENSPAAAQKNSRASVADPQPQHETSKTAVIIGMVGLVALALLTLR